MVVRERTAGHVVVLTLDGDITMGDAGATRLADRVRRLLQEGHERIILDLSHVRYVDSAGLGELVQCCAAARTRSGCLKLLNVTRRLTNLLKLTGLIAVFDACEGDADPIERPGPPLT